MSLCFDDLLLLILLRCLACTQTMMRDANPGLARRFQLQSAWWVF